MMVRNGESLTTLEERIVKFLTHEAIPVCFTNHIAERMKLSYTEVHDTLHDMLKAGFVTRFVVAGGSAWVLTKPRKGAKV